MNHPCDDPYGNPYDFQPVAAPGTGVAPLGADVARVDAYAKVTGQARYTAEHMSSDMSFGVVVNATIALGAIAGFTLDAARAVPGVLDIITYRNRIHTRSLGLFYKDMTAPGGTPFKPLYDEKIEYSGQPVALVVATTFEAARYAASLVEVHYDVRPHQTDLMTERPRAHTPSRLKAGYAPPPKPRGDAQAAYRLAPVRIEAEYYSGVEHHNPMEMHASTVIREADGHLTVYDKTQSSQNSRWYVSRVFGLGEKKVTVKNPFIGGAFGSGLRPQYQLFLAVMAAIKLDRSVRVVLTRQQMFTFGHRPETWQQLKLSADRDGTLRSVEHSAIAETSRREDYVEVVVNWSGQLYKCDNVKLDYKLVALDQYSPIDMRAPGAAHGMHALEVAMDELSYALGMCPLELRLKNYAELDGNKDLPFSSKELHACYAQAAARFGWERRSPYTRATREGNELVGWGMATGTWDAMQLFARAKGVLFADGRLDISSAATDIGTGTYTVMSMIAADAFGLPLEQVTFRLGDSRLPLAPIEGGSSHVSSVGSAVLGVCEKLQKKLWKMARAMPDRRFARARFKDVRFSNGRLCLADAPETGIALGDILRASGVDTVEDKYLLLPDMLEQRKYTRATHSAVFCEVKVDETFGTVRVTRVVSAIAAGRILSARTARSQITGGIVWGISQALHEETHADRKLGRFMNHSLAEYHIAANADIGEIDVIFVDESDHVVSRMGAKGLGEIGIVGVSAAICNAIYHATGRRIRSTPITPDKVMKP